MTASTAPARTATIDRGVYHRDVRIDGMGIFYRDAGPVDAPPGVASNLKAQPWP